MDKYPTVKIGDCCRIEKGLTGIASTEPGEYPLVVTAFNRKSSKTYQFDTKAVCIPLVSSTGHGKKTLNWVHFQEGKFALGTILAAIIPNDPSALSAAFLHRYLQFNKDRKIVPLMKGAANVSLSVKDIAKIEIPIPPIEEQEWFIKLFNESNSYNDELLNEFKTQSNYLSILRQSILQEAIEGKLTAAWRMQNPVRKGDPATDAAALLEKIKLEKQKLIAEGKIKKDKPMAPILPDEIPFELPEGWVWCRLGEIGIVNPRNYIEDDVETSFVPMTFISAKFGRSPEFEIRKWKKIKSGFTHFMENDIGIAKITPCFENAKSCVFKNLKNGFGAGTTELHILRPLLINPFYPYIFVKTTAFLNTGEKLMSGAVGQKRVPVDYFAGSIIPLPSLSEQQAIVDRVNTLLAMVNDLEQQVKERKGIAEEMMQAVMREAF